jgi:hypothetical protein
MIFLGGNLKKKKKKKNRRKEKIRQKYITMHIYRKII